MPWKETSPMNEREQFARDLQSGVFTMTELCRRYDVSRKTGYKWRDRLFEHGLAGLRDRSRAPKSCPHETPEEIQQLILEEKGRYPRWGAPKLMTRLRKRYPMLDLPADSTAGALLARHGLTKPRRKKSKWKQPGAARRKPETSNEIWTADFKGQAKTRDGVECFPLTIADLFSRFLLACSGLTSTKGVGAKKVFTGIFRRCGIPSSIRTDNGSPFCSSNAIHGLCSLNVWWLRMGIHHERTEPGCPQQNGAHERMHRTLKRDTMNPMAATMRGQQRKFDRFRKEYNEERPHDALDGETPGSIYESSNRPFPERVPEPEYSDDMRVRKVSTGGTFRLNSAQPFLSQALCHMYIAIQEVDDGLWAIHFYDYLLAHYDERTGRYWE